MPNTTDRSPPHLIGRREYNEINSHDRKMARRLSWVAAVLGIAACGSSAFAVWEAGQTHTGVIVVEKNKLGESIAARRLEATMEGGPLDPARVKAQLGRWVFDVRSVYTDLIAMAPLYTEAYAWVDKSSGAKAALDEYYSTNSPVSRASVGPVEVTVEGVSPGGGSLWYVDWKEKAHRLDGTTLETYWRMPVTVERDSAPRTDENVIANPAGILITRFNAFQRPR